MKNSTLRVKIVASSHPTSCEEEINKALENGWWLDGRIQETGGPGDSYFWAQLSQNIEAEAGPPEPTDCEHSLFGNLYWLDLTISPEGKPLREALRYCFECGKDMTDDIAKARVVERVAKKMKGGEE